MSSGTTPGQTIVYLAFAVVVYLTSNLFYLIFHGYCILWQDMSIKLLIIAYDFVEPESVVAYLENLKSSDESSKEQVELLCHFCIWYMTSLSD